MAFGRPSTGAIPPGGSRAQEAGVKFFRLGYRLVCFKTWRFVLRLEFEQEHFTSFTQFHLQSSPASLVSLCAQSVPQQLDVIWFTAPPPLGRRSLVSKFGLDRLQESV